KHVRPMRAVKYEAHVGSEASIQQPSVARQSAANAASCSLCGQGFFMWLAAAKSLAGSSSPAGKRTARAASLQRAPCTQAAAKQRDQLPLTSIPPPRE
ncbi:hypothetical protein Dimus_010779, partial [Dionaea muscipula]